MRLLLLMRPGNPSRASSGVCHLSLLIFPLDASWVPVPAGSETGHETRHAERAGPGTAGAPGFLPPPVVAGQRRAREKASVPRKMRHFCFSVPPLRKKKTSLTVRGGDLFKTRTLLF